MAEDKQEQERITLEYPFRGDSPPDDLMALDVACAAHSRGACIITDIGLAAMRVRLEERDYKLRGVQHQGQNWHEMWIEQLCVAGSGE